MSEANPYQAPKARVIDENPSPTLRDSSKIVLTEWEIRAFVGPKADYYLKAWNAADERGMPEITLNWPALLLSALWLPYRKMYTGTVIFYAAGAALALLENFVFVGILGMPNTPSAAGTLQGLLTGIVCGAFGNGWYGWRARRLVSKL